MAWQRSDTPSAEKKREMLADLAMGDILVRKAHGGCGWKAIREIPVRAPWNEGRGVGKERYNA